MSNLSDVSLGALLDGSAAIDPLGDVLLADLGVAAGGVAK